MAEMSPEPVPSHDDWLGELLRRDTVPDGNVDPSTAAVERSHRQWGVPPDAPDCGGLTEPPVVPENKQEIILSMLEEDFMRQLTGDWQQPNPLLAQQQSIAIDLVEAFLVQQMSLLDSSSASVKPSITIYGEDRPLQPAEVEINIRAVYFSPDDRRLIVLFGVSKNLNDKDKCYFMPDRSQSNAPTEESGNGSIAGLHTPLALKSVQPVLISCIGDVAFGGRDDLVKLLAFKIHQLAQEPG